MGRGRLAASRLGVVSPGPRPSEPRERGGGGQGAAVAVIVRACVRECASARVRASACVHGGCVRACARARASQDDADGGACGWNLRARGDGVTAWSRPRATDYELRRTIRVPGLTARGTDRGFR